MKYFIIISFISLFIKQLSLNAQSILFEEYFTDNTLRIDFYLAGNNDTSQVFWHDLKKEDKWAGRKKYLIDTVKYGGFLAEVFDSVSNTLIYSRSFSTFFEEWQTIEEAKNIHRSFEQSILIPFPKKNIIIKIFQRNRNNDFIFIAERDINPIDYFIKHDRIMNVKSPDYMINGPTENKVDLVFLADGYTYEEIGKYRKDVEKLTNKMFSTSPYKDNKEKFNIRIIESVSEESGTDIPGENIWKNTVLNTHFYTFNSERYLTTMSNFIVRDYAAVVPYDYIYIVVNSSKYGGGGVYNHLNVVSSDNKHSPFVFIHEFGHGFAGLGDEYFSSSVSYQDYYNLNVEPVQPNVTSLINFENKWKDMIDEGTPIPTPVDPQYKNVIGVFEGAGYVSKGMYRPYLDCMMKSKTAKEFCPVCKRAIQSAIIINCD
ncbi:M64 family metallopeptidase [Bacteroidota bacterium]